MRPYPEIAELEMPKWERKKGTHLVKQTKMSDGEILHLLLGTAKYNSDPLDHEVYESLKEIKKKSNGLGLWVFASATFGALAHFGVLKSVNASGLEVYPAFFSQVALLALSFSTMMFCFSSCKQTYLQTWFNYKIKDSTSSEKAKFMLRYPEAYWYFSYLPGVIGYPPHIHGRRSGYAQLAYIALVVIALLLFSISSIALWIAIASDVWASEHVSKSVLVLTLGLSAITTIIGCTAPFYYDIPRNYFHYGLVSGLSNLSEKKRLAIHRKMVPIAVRMGLLEPL